MLAKFLKASVVCLLLCVGLPVGAQPGVAHLDNREAFNASADGLSIIDFESVAPARGFGKYPVEQGLTVRGVHFRTHGGARFGPGMVFVLSEDYARMNPAYNTGTAGVLTWSPPNQPGTAYLDVTLPAGVTAVGADIWAGPPYVSSVEVTAVTTGGVEQTVNVNTLERPAASFVGFVSDSAIHTLRLRLPKGQSRLLLDNLAFGRKSARAVVAATPARPSAPAAIGAASNAGENVAEALAPLTSPASTSTPSASPSPTSSPSTSPSPTSSPSAADESQSNVNDPTPAAPAQQGASASDKSAGVGTIAYVRGGTEIRLIQPDGSNDRRLWTHPDATYDLGLFDLAWRPDGKELAFSSGHAAVRSLYHADLYAVRPDGSGFRKLTNAPDSGEFGRYPKGAVSVTLRNDQPAYQQAQASAGVFIVYVAGADEPQQVTLPPGSTKTLLFKSVADFGKDVQPVVAMWGRYRWFIPGTDVQAGRTTKAPVFSIRGDGIPLLGAFRPVWRSDGSRVSYRSGLCTLNSVPANPPAGEYIFNPLFGGENPLGTCTWDWGPTPALADQLIYTENASGDSSVYRIKEGGTHPGTKLTAYTDIESQLLIDLRWLPDGSGFLYTKKTLFDDAADFYRYDFGTRRLTQLTQFEKEFARKFSVSPDGRWVVFERAKTSEEGSASDLWLMDVDGKNMRLLVRNGGSPSWGR